VLCSATEKANNSCLKSEEFEIEIDWIGFDWMKFILECALNLRGAGLRMNFGTSETLRL
jgi:hypothetical protein